MATIKKQDLGRNQFGGFTPDGNVTTYRATLETLATGAVKNSNSTAAAAIGDVIVLEFLPQGMVLEDAQTIVSTTLTALVKADLGFIYADGVDSTDVPQDAAYFNTAIDLATAGRVRAASAKAPVKLAKDAFLVMTLSGANNAKAGRVDVIVHGERMGPK